MYTVLKVGVNLKNRVVYTKLTYQVVQSRIIEMKLVIVCMRGKDLGRTLQALQPMDLQTPETHALGVTGNLISHHAGAWVLTYLLWKACRLLLN